MVDRHCDGGDVTHGDIWHGVGTSWCGEHPPMGGNPPQGTPTTDWGHGGTRDTLTWGTRWHRGGPWGCGAVVAALSHGPTGGGAVLGTETAAGKHRGHAHPQPSHRGATTWSQPGRLGDVLQAHTGCSGDGDGVTAVGRHLGCGEKRPQGLGVPRGSVPKGMASEVDGADVPVGALCSVPSQGAGGCTGWWRGPMGSLRPLAAGRKLWVRVGKSSSGHACATVPFRGGWPYPSPDESKRHRGCRGSPRCVSPATAGLHASARPRALTPFCVPH